MATGTILIVEDDALIAAHIEAVLSSAGHTVLPPLAFGEEAITAIAERAPDLIMMDIELAGDMDGITAAAGIRERYDIPVIYLTGHTPRDTRLEQARATNPYAYLAKPISGHELAATVDMVLYRHAADRRLRDSEAQYRALVENIPGAVYSCEVDPPWRVQHFSASVLALTGRPAEYFLAGQVNWADIMMPEDMPRVVETVAAAIAGHRPYNLQYRIRHTDGSLRWVHEIGQCIYAADGSPLRLEGVNYDITAHKEAERALAEIEGRYRRIVETAGEGIWIVSPAGITTFANPRLAEMLGYTVEEMVGQSSMIAVFPENVPDQQRRLHDRRCGYEERYEQRYHRKDGRTIWMAVSATPITDAAGQFAGSLGMFTDITERKQAEAERDTALEALREREAYLTTVVENLPGLVWLKDVRGTYKVANQAFAARCGGRTPAEIVGRSDPDLLPSDLADRYQGEDAQVMATGQPLVLQNVPGDDADSGPRWSEVHKRPVRDVDGAIVGTAGYSHDVTAIRRAAEERLRIERELLREVRQREAYLQAIIDNLPGVVWLKDRDGRFLALNRAHAVPSGLDGPEHIVGKTDLDILPHEQAERYRAEDAAVMESGQPLRIEEEIIDRGQRKWIQKYKTPIRDADGTTIGTTGYSHDITPLKCAADERVLLERLEAERTRDVAVLTGHLAREFNNLLQTLLADVDLALSDTNSVVTQRTRVASALQAASQAMERMRPLLSLGSTGRVQITRGSLERLLDDNRRLFDAAVGPNATLDVILANNTVPLIADPDLLRLALLHLLTNAAEAIGNAPGRVTLSVGKVDCDATCLSRSRLPEKTAAGHYVCFEVADTGSGMDDAMLQRLFEPGFTTRATGRGLGLTVVATIVSAHGGAVIVDSRPGHGTAVRLLLPTSSVENHDASHLSGGP